MAAVSGGKEPPDRGIDDIDEASVPSPGGYVSVCDDGSSSSSDNKVVVSYHDFTLAPSKKRKSTAKRRRHEFKRTQRLTTDTDQSQIPLGQISQPALTTLTDTFPLGQNINSQGADLNLSKITDSLFLNLTIKCFCINLLFVCPWGWLKETS
ncbi:hypothetical protein ACJJTC_008690 [Scirpophaga incertulas]